MVKISVPNREDTMDIDRKDMPQIKSHDMKGCLNHLKDDDVVTVKKTVDPSKLNATQGHFNKGKIEGMMVSLEKGEMKNIPILISQDNFVMDGHHRWLANMNLENDIDVYQVNLDAGELLDMMKDYPKSFTEKLYECFEYVCEADTTCDLVTPSHMKSFEKVVDKMFAKFNIDFDFTKHFADRMSDDRNKPCIKIKELADMIMKIYKKQGKSLKNSADAEAVVKDIQSDLNVPVVIKYDKKNDEFDVVMKTIMRKKDFKTSNKIIKY